MGNFIGSTGDDVITPGFVSPLVTASGGAAPGDDADTISGGAGRDTIDGGAGADVIRGGQDADVLLGGEGDDLFQWNPGDGSDSVDGGAGADTLEFQTSNISETITLGMSGGVALLTRDVASITQQLASVERIKLGGLASGGADSFLIGDLSGTAVQRIDIDLGSLSGVDNTADRIQLGGRAVADTFVVSTQNGVTSVTGPGPIVSASQFDATDRLAILAGDGADTVDISAFGAGITLNLDGGAGTDTLLLRGTTSGDRIVVTGVSGVGPGDGFGVDNNGQFGLVSTTGFEGFVVEGGDGDDTVSAIGGAPALQIAGGAGNDNLRGSARADTINGGSGADTIAGGQDADVLLGGEGDDLFQWNPGDGSDSVDGGAGADTLEFQTSNISETITLGMSGGVALLTRDVASITQQLASVERIKLGGLASGGADSFLIGDLSGTAVQRIDIDLGSLSGVDNTADRIQLGGRAVADTFVVSTQNGVTSVTGPGPIVSASQFDATDRLAILAGDGADTVDISAFGAGITLNLDGGAGTDTLLLRGSTGGDRIVFADGPQVGPGDSLSIQVNGQSGAMAVTGFEVMRVDAGDGDDSVSSSALSPAINARFSGGAGNDNLAGGSGADTLLGDAGNDVLRGLAGADSMIGGDGADTLSGGQDNDVIAGGRGADIFEFGSGQGRDILIDFRPGEDDIRFVDSGFASFAQVMANATQSGAHVLITVGPGDVLQINNVLLSSLTASDFLFG